MGATISKTDIKRRYQDLEAWAQAFTATLEARLRARTQWQRLHCFVMDQFEEEYPDEHLSRDQKFVFLSLRVAIDLRDQDPSVVDHVKTLLKGIKPSLRILNESFHDAANVIDLDWHISEQEREEDQGEGFAKLVLEDCLLIAAQVSRV